MKRALIAMSGGVDSAVAAMLARDAGYECLGCTMRLWDAPPGDGSGRTCCSLDDAEDARSVAFRLGLRHYVFNLTEAFRDSVIRDFTGCYLRGETPNPCIVCNRELKFGALLQRAAELDCGTLVTGHYARVSAENGAYYLKKAKDAAKDQTYVLYMLNQEQLARIRFPLGDYTKAEVREIAEKNGFSNARKPDSQDICFVPDGDYAAVIEAFTGAASEPGDFVDQSGKVLGRHRGIIRYTLGQHRGLGLYWHEPLYVLRIDAKKNRVVLGPKEALYSRTVTVPDFHWISGQPPAGPVRCSGKTRYRQPEQPLAAYPLPGGGARLEFDQPQRAVTPGQSAVLYDRDTVLGGGIIGRNEVEQ